MKEIEGYLSQATICLIKQENLSAAEFQWQTNSDVIPEDKGEQESGAGFLKKNVSPTNAELLHSTD